MLLLLLDFEYRKRVKSYKRKVINDFREKLDKGANATSKRTVSSVVTGAFTPSSNVI